MAQGRQENGPGEQNANPFGITADMWNEAAKRRNFRVHDGAPMIEKDGAVAPSHAPTSLDEVFHAVQEYRRNRIGGSLNGTALATAVAKAASGEGLPNPKSNDAFDSVYRDRIGELVDAAKGWDDAALKAMSAADKLARNDLIAASCADSDNREKYYDTTVREAIELGTTAGAKRESQRAKAKPKADALKF